MHPKIYIFSQCCRFLCCYSKKCALDPAVQDVLFSVCAHTYFLIHFPFSCIVFWVTVICRLITQSPLRQPDQCSTAVLSVTSAPSTRSPHLRSSGVLRMESLLRIQNRALHTSNCDGVFHLGSTALFLNLFPG